MHSGVTVALSSGGWGLAGSPILCCSQASCFWPSLGHRAARVGCGSRWVAAWPRVRPRLVGAPRSLCGSPRPGGAHSAALLPVGPAHLAHHHAGVYGVYKCGHGAPCLPRGSGARPGRGSLLHETAGNQGADYRLGLARPPGRVRELREVAVPSLAQLCSPSAWGAA